MCKLETPKSRYFVMRDYIKTLISVLDVTAPSAIEDNAFKNIILDWLAQENVPAKYIKTVEFKCGDPILKIDGYDITTQQKADCVLRFKLYKHTINYSVQQEEDLPF